MAALPLSPAFGLFKALDRNKPGTPETRNAERINAPYRSGGQGASMLTQPDKQF